jgi:phosphoribosylformylglycinamidine synthase
MYHLFGPSPHTAAELRRLVTRMKQYAPNIEGCKTQTVYCLEVAHGVASESMSLIQSLLQLDKLCLQPADYLGQMFIALPRLGTVSSWSLSASDVLARCGVEDVRRIEKGCIFYIETQYSDPLQGVDFEAIARLLHDPFVETLYTSLFDVMPANQVQHMPYVAHIDVQKSKKDLVAYNTRFRLQMGKRDIDYLYDYFKKKGRNPTDAELWVYALVNSDRTKHGVFKARWVDKAGKALPHSLFGMIRNTCEKNTQGIQVAYVDNAAVVVSGCQQRYGIKEATQSYGMIQGASPKVIKTEMTTTSASVLPKEGFAAACSAEIRDEGSTGLGSTPMVGMSGMCVSYLRMPNYQKPWESERDIPHFLASAIRIVTEGFEGCSRYNRQFGRPLTCGFLRTYEMDDRAYSGRYFAYDHPLVLSGGYGHVRQSHRLKHRLAPSTRLILLGGPSMLIGVGGASIASMAKDKMGQGLDYSVVQHDQPEMQRRCQEVINRCTGLGDDNPIQSIYDVASGGLAVAVTELVYASGRGAHIELQQVPVVGNCLNPMEILCNESQERYLLAVHEKDLPRLFSLAEREQCPCHLIGQVIKEHTIRINNQDADGQNIIELPLSFLIDETPVRQLTKTDVKYARKPLKTDVMTLDVAAMRLFQLVAVGDKSCFITAMDQTAGGLVTQGPMVGPWQVPVADVSVAADHFDTFSGQAMSVGERIPLAAIDPPAAARIAIGEAITNLAAADVQALSDVVLSINWSGFANDQGLQDLYDAVETVGLSFCAKLGVSVPSGQDLMSLGAQWQVEKRACETVAPTSAVVTAYAPVGDVRKTVTPDIKSAHAAESVLYLFDLSGEKTRHLGGSALGDVSQQSGNQGPDVMAPKRLIDFVDVMRVLREAGKVLAYHDRSDGGVFVTLCEMAFSGRVGLTINLDGLGGNPFEALFYEGLGVVIQVLKADVPFLESACKTHHLSDALHAIGAPNSSQNIVFSMGGKVVLQERRLDWQRLWHLNSYRIATMRDDPECAKEAYEQALRVGNSGLQSDLTYDLNEDIAAPLVAKYGRPKVAICREQGTIAHYEMAFAFERAGFTPVDVTLSDLVAQRVLLDQFAGIVFCGGFSFGHVFGPAVGWSKLILEQPKVRAQFQAFFAREDSFTLGVAEGAQLLVYLKDLIPGVVHWPTYEKNRSRRFESRLVQVRVESSKSILTKDMVGSYGPMWVAHEYGRAVYRGQRQANQAHVNRLVSLRYVNQYGREADHYPDNPDGSIASICGLTSADGRVTLMMPRPERGVRACQLGWHPEGWDDAGPWLRFFQNARVWLGDRLWIAERMSSYYGGNETK